MRFLGIGLLELLFILILMVIVLGPKGMVKAARELGKLIHQVTHSSLWAEVMHASSELRDIPQKIMHEAGIEDDLADLRHDVSQTLDPTMSKFRQQNQSVNISLTGEKLSENLHKKESHDS